MICEIKYFKETTFNSYNVRTMHVTSYNENIKHNLLLLIFQTHKIKNNEDTFLTLTFVFSGLFRIQIMKRISTKLYKNAFLFVSTFMEHIF